jgi:hypothetical protein
LKIMGLLIKPGSYRLAREESCAGYIKGFVEIRSGGWGKRRKFSVKKKSGGQWGFLGKMAQKSNTTRFTGCYWSVVGGWLLPLTRLHRWRPVYGATS